MFSAVVLSWTRIEVTTCNAHHYGYRFPFPDVQSHVDNKIVLCEKCVTGEDEVDAAFEILMKWFSLTRLETRTKESNIYASIRVFQTQNA